MQIVQSKCPACGKMVNYLEFFMKVGDKYFHICKNCLNIPLSFEKHLEIGFHYGREAMRKEFKDFLAGEIDG